jgi:methylated-DNA-[protein]-cysteine S-methyltransferase
METTCLDTTSGQLAVTIDGDAVVGLRWRRRPARTALVPVPSALAQEAVRQLTAYFDRRLTDFDLPVRLDGTDFDLAVWREMRLIPYGQTRTYGDLAAAIGGIARAVGTACGRNPVPVIVPCHRVVAGNGSLGGFSGGRGRETKSILLDLERQQGRLF